MTVEQTVELCHVSWEGRLFWMGFSAASFLFLIGFMVANLVPSLRAEREKRRSK